MICIESYEKESYENAISCYICKEKFENEYLKDKKYCKVVTIPQNKEMLPMAYVI